MKKTPLIFALLVLLSFSISAQGPQLGEAIKSYGIVEYSAPTSTSELSTCGGMNKLLTDSDTQEIHSGQFPMPDIFVSRLWYAPHVKKMKEHEYYPDIKIIIYRNFRKVGKTRDEAWASQKDYHIAEYEFALENNLLVKDSSGEYVYSKTYGTDYLLVDVTNPLWHEFVANWIKFYIDNYGFDGVYLDNGFSSVAEETYFGVSATPINPSTGTYFTDEEIIQAHIQVHQKIRDIIGENHLLLCNGIFHGQRFFKRKNGYTRVLDGSPINGFLSEGLFGGEYFWTEQRWKASVDFVSWVQDNWLAKDKKNYFLPNVDFFGGSTTGEEQWAGKDEGVSLEQYVTFIFASTLLGIETKYSEQNYFSNNGWFYDWAQELVSIDLGEPKEDYYVVEGTAVYVRAFEKGKVFVNPTYTSYTIAGRTFNPHEGIIEIETPK